MAQQTPQFEDEPFGYGRLIPDHLLPSSPAVATGLVFPLDSRWWWRIVALRFLLATDANAGNRFVTVDYCDAEGNAWIRNPAPAVVAANVAAQEFDFGIGALAVSGLAGEPIFGRLARTYIPGGWQLRVNVDNVKAADQLSAFRLYVEKFLPAGEPSSGSSSRRSHRPAAAIA